MSPDKIRHILKTITWRMVGTVDTIVLSWALSGNLSLGIKIGSVELITKMILYYAHERVWFKYIRIGNKNGR
jgi:uncharacterized membrane protein